MPKATAASAEEKIQYILTVLKHTDLNQPNYQAVAKETGHSNANSAQKKFKSYIEQAGFKLLDRQVIGEDGNKGEKKAKSSTPSSDSSAATPKTSTSKKSARKKSASAQQTPSKTQSNETGRSAKKRKIEDVLEISDDEEQTDAGEEAGEEVKREDVNGDSVNDIDAGEDGDGDDWDIDEDGDRFRRSRARSATLKAEAVY